MKTQVLTFLTNLIIDDRKKCYVKEKKGQPTVSNYFVISALCFVCVSELLIIV